MTAAITVDNLSKQFHLRHQAGGAGYSTFRDAFASGAQKTLGRMLGRKGKDQESEEVFWALRDVNFTVAPGDKIGVIGRNGAGKSTLLKVISRIIEPSAGRIRISGRVASLLEVGTGFHPELTGRENIYFSGAILGMTRAEISQRFDEIVAFAEVEKFLDTPVKHFSSGMYVRLGFAVAAHLEPEILIIDEILAVGDARFQKKCLGKLQDIGQHGRTILFVSHNMSSILQFTDRVILFQQGQILLDGDSETGVREYLRVNEEATQAVNLSARVPWLRIEEFTFDQTCMAVGFNKPLQFRLKLSLDRAINEVEIVLPLFNSIGARLITARTVLSSLTRGNHTLRLQIPEHRLIPGTYLISMIIRDRAETIFFREQIIVMELVADEIEDPMLLPLIATGKDRFGAYCPLHIDGYMSGHSRFAS
jgi:lipopolysaccharide transport system ATP-binding protein